MSISKGDGVGGAAWAVHGYGQDSEDDDDGSSKDGSMKGSGDGDDIHNGNGETDAEGVWSPDIEQSFQEALAIYPPCGRRKIILSDEGKMYGRNELIARYIKLRTGKTRTRKQVSSHIQVLARRKAREIQSKIKNHSRPAGPSSEDIKALYGSGYSEKFSGLNLMNANNNHLHNIAAINPSVKNEDRVFLQHSLNQAKGDPHSDSVAPYKQVLIPFPTNPILGWNNNTSVWEGRTICSNKLRLSEFVAFQDCGPGTEKHVLVEIDTPTPTYSDPLLEDIDLRQFSDKFPSNKTGLKELFDKGPQNAFFLVKFWADLNVPSPMDKGPTFYGATSQFESSENMILSCSTKVCSFGKQVVEKLEVIEYPSYVNDRYIYRLDRSEMCEYMVNFIHKLKDLPEKYMMNSVLENFTILQVISNRETQETLLCIAFVFEVSVSDNGAHHHVYRLVKPSNNENHWTGHQSPIVRSLAK